MKCPGSSTLNGLERRAGRWGTPIERTAVRIMYHKCDEGLNLRTTIGGLQRNKKRKKNGIDTGSTECISYLDLEGKGKKRYGVLWYLGERWYELGQNQVFVLNALKH